MAGDDRYCLYLVTDLNLFSSCSGREAAFSEPTFSLLNFFPAFIIFQVAAFFFLALSKASKISRQLSSLAQTSVRPLLYLVPNERGAAPILCILSIKPFKSWYLHFSYQDWNFEGMPPMLRCVAACGLWSQLRSNNILFEIVFDWWYALSVAL